MPFKKFVSIRLEPGLATRVHVDKVAAAPHAALNNLTKFTLRSQIGAHSNKGSLVSIEALRWPPPDYDASSTLALNAQWPMGQAFYEPNDTAGHHAGRSFSEVEFTYDQAAKKLSWSQKNAAGRGKLQGSVEFNATTPVWNVVLAMDPGAPGTKGEMLVNGADITPP